MPVLAPAAFAAAASFFATPVFGAITFGSIATTLALSGASFLINAALAPSGGRTPADQGQKLTVQQAVPGQRLIYGRALVGGPIFFYEAKPPYLYIGIILCSHEIDGVDEIRIGDEPVVIDANGNAINSKFNDGLVSYLKVSIQNGTDTQGIDPILNADFPELEATYAQEGHATAVLRLYYGIDADDHEKFWGSGSPRPHFLVKGMKCYDPRKASHDIADRLTWEWTDNASLCLADYLTNRKGFNRHWSKINMNDLTESANIDDQQMALLDGSFEARYTVNGVVDTSVEPVQPVLDMLTANVGHLVWRDGKYSILSGAPRAAVWTLNDNSARGTMNARYHRSSKDLVNVVRTRFTSPEREYQTAEGPVLKNLSYIAIDGEEHEITITLPFTASHTRAQRIAKIVMERARLGKLITRRESIEALILSAVDKVNIESDFRPILGMVAEINRINLSEETLEVEIEMEEFSNDIFDWVAAVDEQPFELIATELQGVN